MSIRRYSSGSTFEAEIGYSRAVADDLYLHISGTTGYDYSTMQISADVAEQAERCMLNIEAVLLEHQVPWDNVVRVRYILPNPDDFEPCWPVLKKYFASAPPAATMISADLADPAMKIEIELTARLPE